MGNFLMDIFKMGKKEDKKEKQTTKDSVAAKFFSESIAVDYAEQVEILSSHNLAEKLTECELEHKGLLTNSEEWIKLYAKNIKFVENKRKKAEKVLLKFLKNDFEMLKDRIDGDAGKPKDKKDESKKLVDEKVFDTGRKIQSSDSKIKPEIKKEENVDVKSVNTTEIGDGKEPNKYWVSYGNDFYYYSKPGTVDWASDKYPIKYSGKTEGPFATFEEAKNRFDTIVDTVLSEPDPKKPSEGSHSAFIEDRISGEIYSAIYTEIEVPAKLDYELETQDDTRFTKERLGDKFALKITDKQIKKEENVDVKSVNTTEIGDGKEPNKYWVSYGNDFYYYSKPGTVDWASDKYPIKYSGKTEGPFATFEEAKNRFDTIVDTVLSEPDPKKPSEGSHSAFIEDRISGEIYSAIYTEIEVPAKLDYELETQDDTRFTKERLGDKFALKITDKQIKKEALAKSPWIVKKDKEGKEVIMATEDKNKFISPESVKKMEKKSSLNIANIKDIKLNELPESAQNRIKAELEAAEKKPDQTIKDRLKYLRKQIINENISTGEILELQSLAKYIKPSDVLLLEWAGVPEFPEDKESKKDRLEYFRRKIEKSQKGIGKTDMSYAEMAELQSLREYIEPGDVLLLEWAGVPEFPEDKESNKKEATGEMGKQDIEEGGEYYDWAKAIQEEVEELSTMTDGKLKFIRMEPFDKYQGPYAVVEINGKPDKIWSFVDEVSNEEGLYIEHLKVDGNNDALAEYINNEEYKDKSDVKPSVKQNAPEIPEGIDSEGKWKHSITLPKLDSKLEDLKSSMVKVTGEFISDKSGYTDVEKLDIKSSLAVIAKGFECVANEEELNSILGMFYDLADKYAVKFDIQE